MWSLITSIDKDHLDTTLYKLGNVCRKFELKNKILEGHLKMTVIYTSKQGAGSRTTLGTSLAAGTLP